MGQEPEHCFCEISGKGGGMTAYYNEIDQHAAYWLRELIKSGHIADGIVDERDIQDVMPNDLAGFTQCHFFAGIGGWSYALRKSGWPDDRHVWTGSCPCQPFSAAGKGAAFADERHLWPAFHHLIREHRPVVVFGEQVASKDADAWIDLVQDDMEALGYAVGAVPFPAASVGSPHIRDRLYWVANSSGERLDKRKRFSGIPGQQDGDDARKAAVGNGVCAVGRLADLHGVGLDSRRKGFAAVGYRQAVDADSGAGRLAGANGCSGMFTESAAGPTNGFWRDADWLGCRDGKFRPVEPGTFPLADGIPARVVRLRGYGNAINAVQAQAFVEAFMDYRQAAA